MRILSTSQFKNTVQPFSNLPKPPEIKGVKPEIPVETEKTPITGSVEGNKTNGPFV